MLILTRRPGETIIIELPTGELIQVAVLGMKGSQVRIKAEDKGLWWAGPLN
jgi:sRNA-binding carbon storage regulator CsrA